MKNRNYKFLIIALLALMIGTFTHCVQNAPTGGSSSSGSSSRTPSGTTAKTPEQVINEAQVEVGMKNFEQINYTFSELTGVPVSTGAINTTYTSVEATLPTENAVKVLQSSNQVAITRLAAEYCNQLITVGAFSANRNTLFGATIFATVYNSLSANQVNSFVNQTTNAFWGEGVIDPVELAEARAELLDLFRDIADMDTAQNRATTNVTLKATRAVCAAALSSSYVTVM